jgi:hypothetical protein
MGIGERSTGNHAGAEYRDHPGGSGRRDSMPKYPSEEVVRRIKEDAESRLRMVARTLPAAIAMLC